MKCLILIFFLCIVFTDSYCQEESDNTKFTYVLGVSYRSSRHFYSQLNTPSFPSRIYGLANYSVRSYSGFGLAGEVRLNLNQFILFYNPVIRYDVVEFSQNPNRKFERRMVFDQNMGLMLNRKVNFGIGYTTISTFNKIKYIRPSTEQEYLHLRIPGILFMIEQIRGKFLFHLDLIHIGYGKDFTTLKERSLSLQLKVARFIGE